jgi:hypothetical protein
MSVSCAVYASGKAVTKVCLQRGIFASNDTNLPQMGEILFSSVKYASLEASVLSGSKFANLLFLNHKSTKISLFFPEEVGF